jgi:N-sulfoglucosamine sulfohydrolase
VGWTRRDVLGATAALALGSCGARGPRRTSVLLLVADDLGRRDLGVYGQRSCATPHLDALAGEGLLAHRAYTPAALCRPSRTSLLTGLYPHATGRSWYGAVREDLDQWPDHFRRAGHRPGVIGKTALAKHAERWGFAEGGQVAHETGRDPAFFAELTGRFLDGAGDDPFALVVNFFDPHRAGEKVASDPARLTATRDELRKIAPPPGLPRTKEVLVELRNYYRDVERMDRAVGAVLEVLGERGRAEDTLVIFLSDNGADFPFAKATLYEAGINLPLLVRWPGVVAAGEETRALLSFVDLLPTCLEAAGARAPVGIDGRSFVPLLDGRQAAHRERIFGEHDEHRGETNTPSRSVVDARFKYVRHFKLGERFEVASMRTASWQSMQRASKDDPELAARMGRLVQRPREELFDLEEDPWELVDLARDPARRTTLEAQRGALRAWMESESDPLLAEWDA